MDGVSGVGISFGADRIYDVLNQLDLFKEIRVSSTEVLVVNFGDQETAYALGIIDQLRTLGVRTEFYPDAVKLKKQMSYADAKKIPFIVIAGVDEITGNSINVKNMSTGAQVKLPLNELESFVLNNLRPV
jgi:histidyl-tRNA synthetase